MEEQVNKEIGDRIRSLRKEKIVSKKQLASILGVSVQQADKYENGCNRISAAKLLILLNKCGIDCGTFLQEKNLEKRKLLAAFAKIENRMMRRTLLDMMALMANGN
jgi:transcriptional regulator with XRE-family HTH domain